jgi:hypothetical protein
MIIFKINIHNFQFFVINKILFIIKFFLMFFMINYNNKNKILKIYFLIYTHRIKINNKICIKYHIQKIINKL